MSDCPSCRTPGMEPFYTQQRVASHSVLLLDSAEEAHGFPAGRIELAVCHACGFVSNVAVDERLQAYSSQCEETQAFSPRFREFAHELAERIVQRHDVRGKTVLEIGCGKGEFLSMLCEAGANHGIGIDPAVIPDRLPKPARGELEVIADYYDARHAEVDADLVLCRHTLEHIPRTLDFLELVMASRPGRSGALLVFELPDMGRVLREHAFWDVYYEHCSYFTPGSLARLFRSAACEPLELELDFDDQYILISGRRGAGGGGPLPLEDTPERVAEAARAFARGVERTIDGWRERIAAVRAEGGRVALWGSGSKAVSFLSHLDSGVVDAVVDVNPHRHGRFLPGSGVEVESPERLRELRPALVIAMNPIYRSEIGADLAAMGLDSVLDAV